MSASPFAGYDIWLQRGADAPGADGYIEGYPVICTECRERVHANAGAEDLFGVPHCRDEDTGEIVGSFVCESDYDFTYDDPRIP